MRCPVAEPIASGREKARETVERETPAASATWLMVGAVREGGFELMATFVPLANSFAKRAAPGVE
jgi:hypothetical protein